MLNAVGKSRATIQTMTRIICFTGSGDRKHSEHVTLDQNLNDLEHNHDGISGDISGDMASWLRPGSCEDNAGDVNHQYTRHTAARAHSLLSQSGILTENPNLTLTHLSSSLM